MKERIEEEIDILSNSFPGMEYVASGHWVKIPDYPLPPGWNHQRTEVAFQIPYPGYPGSHPYGIYVPGGLLFGGGRPRNYTEPAANRPPFAGIWGVFSWQPEKWNPAASITAGSNLWTWVKSFSVRFREGL